MSSAARDATFASSPDLGRRRRARVAWLLGALAGGGLAALPLAMVASLVRQLEPETASLARLGEAALGSLKLVLLACAVGFPLGLLLGVACADQRAVARSRVAMWTVDAIEATPPIVTGLAVGSVSVVASHAWALVAAALGLALGIAPRVARAVSERLGSTALELRRAGLALGVARWRVLVLVELRSLAPWLGAVTLFGAARAFGEVAPLVFTASTSRWIRGSLQSPIASLPMEVFDSASSGDARASDSALASLVLATITWGMAHAARRLAARSSRNGAHGQ